MIENCQEKKPSGKKAQTKRIVPLIIKIGGQRTIALN